MVWTNRENLLEAALNGEITHSAVAPSYATGWDERPRLGLGRGGIVYNVKVGDPCFGWASGDHVEPGVNPILSNRDGRIENRIDPNANIALYLGLRDKL